MLPCLVLVLFTFLIQGVLKFEKNSVAKGLKVNPRKTGNPSYDVAHDTCLFPHVNQTSHTHHQQSNNISFVFARDESFITDHSIATAAIIAKLVI
jgi:hypothetical protein